MRVAPIPMKVEVGNFEANWQEFKRRFEEALEHSPDIMVSLSTASRALMSGTSAGQSSMMRL